MNSNTTYFQRTHKQIKRTKSIETTEEITRNREVIHKEFKEKAESNDTLVLSIERKDAPVGGTGTLQSM